MFNDCGMFTFTSLYRYHDKTPLLCGVVAIHHQNTNTNSQVPIDDVDDGSLFYSCTMEQLVSFGKREEDNSFVIRNYWSTSFILFIHAVASHTDTFIPSCNPSFTHFDWIIMLNRGSDTSWYHLRFITPPTEESQVAVADQAWTWEARAMLC
jgi:hypothetical protein